MSNQKKMVVVVGSTHGIGFACTKRFLDAGFRVIGCARGVTDNRGQDMEKNFSSYKHFKVDIRDEIAVKEFFGNVDSPSVVLICAGIGIASIGIDEFNLTDAKSVVDVNLLGTAIIMKYALPLMVKGGCLAVCGSIAADSPNTGADWTYASSKAGLVPLFKAAAQDPKFAQISLLHLNLGYIQTRMTVTDDKQAWLLKTPYAKPGEPLEISDRIFSAIQSAMPGYSSVPLIGGDLPENYPLPKMHGRMAGVLMPVSALPNSSDCGTLSSESFPFIKKISDCGFTYWLTLPLNPTGISNSPYCPQSSLGGNINLISFDELLSRKEIQKYRLSSPQEVDYAHCYKSRPSMLRIAWKKFSRSKETPKFEKFCLDNSWWLDDFAVFFAIKALNGGKAWQEWDDSALRTHDSVAIKDFVANNEDAVNVWKFSQYIFFQQLRKLVNYAHEQGVKVIGDLPFYVSTDSVDVWANRNLFNLNDDGTARLYAGTPHEDHRHWGVPAYRWSEHIRDGFSWWRRRIKFFGELFDGLRMDHASGIVANYLIPNDGTEPYFKDAPSEPLLTAITNEAARFGTILLAEDLGIVPDGFREQLTAKGWYVMRVMQFSFKLKYGASNIHLPLNYARKTMVFTGTHDNETLREYLSKLDGEDLDYALFMLGTKNPDELRERILHEIYFSRADFCTLPIQDVLDLGKESTIVYHENCDLSWRWRLDDLSRLDALTEKMRALAVLSGRLPGDKSDFHKALEVLKNE